MNNIFMVIGRITKDLELRYTENNKAVCNVNLAINNAIDDTTFIKISLWNKVAETTHKYCKKGDLIGISGIIKNHNWEDEKGTKHYDYDFIGNKIIFLQNKKNNVEEKEETKENDIDPFEEYGNTIEIDDTFLD